MPADADQRGGLHAVPAPGGTAEPEVFDRPPPGVLRQVLVLRMEMLVQGKVTDPEEEMPLARARQLEELLLPGVQLAGGKILRTKAAEGGRQGQGGDALLAAGILSPAFAGLSYIFVPLETALPEGIVDIFAFVPQRIDRELAKVFFLRDAGGMACFFFPASMRDAVRDASLESQDQTRMQPVTAKMMRAVSPKSQWCPMRRPPMRQGWRAGARVARQAAEAALLSGASCH